MSGHSKWKNIMHKKEKTDKQRASVFTKIGREIVLAVKNGGPDPESNGRLKDIILKAKANNVPNDNIERCIKKASGEGENVNYEEIAYEGYGPAGIAVIVEAVTENRNRTAADVRHYFDKFGGNLGASNSVLWQFKQCGLLIIEKEDVDEDELMMCALDNGADDFDSEGEVFEITTDPAQFSACRQALEEAGYQFATAEITRIADNNVSLTDEKDRFKMQLLLDALEDDDDVQEVAHNWEA